MRHYFIMLSEEFGQRLTGKRGELLMLMSQAFPNCFFEVGVGRPVDDYIDDFGDVTIARVAGSIGSGFYQSSLPVQKPAEVADMQSTVMAFANSRRLVMN